MLIPRDPNRIDRVTELLREAWHLQPDSRLTQLIMVVSDKADDVRALWHVEDETLEDKLRAFVAGLKRQREQNQRHP